MGSIPESEYEREPLHVADYDGSGDDAAPLEGGGFDPTTESVGPGYVEPGFLSDLWQLPPKA